MGGGHEARIVEHADGSIDWSGFDMWLTVDPEPLVASVPAGTVLAGEMPPGSVRVEVRGAGEALDSVVAGGRFLVLVSGRHRQGQVFPLFRDERGSIVSPALGEELKREALHADDVACPACDGRDWDRVEWRVEKHDGRERRGAVLCHTCGHAPIGVWIAERRTSRDEPSPRASPPPLSPDPAAAEIIEAASFPVYVLDDPELVGPSYAGASWTEGRLLSISLGARRGEASVEVTSQFDGVSRIGTPRLVRNALEMYLMRRTPVERDPDDDVTALRRAEAQRRLWAAIERAPARAVALRVEDETVEAELVEHPDGWAANAGTVTVKGRDVSPDEVALRLLRPDDRLASACGP